MPLPARKRFARVRAQAAAEAEEDTLRKGRMGLSSREAAEFDAAAATDAVMPTALRLPPRMLLSDLYQGATRVIGPLFLLVADAAACCNGFGVVAEASRVHSGEGPRTL